MPMRCSAGRRMRPSLWMERYDVRPSVCEILHILIDRRDHQMDVKWLSAMWAQRLYDRRANGNIRHKMSIHDVNMDPVATSGVDGAHFFTQPRKVS